MAVYTDVSDDELRRFVADYAIGELVFFTGIAEGVENSNFLLRTTGGTYILTLYEKRVARGDLPFFLGLLDHLAGRGVTCPTPLTTVDGRVLRELCGRPAAIMSFLDGLWPRAVRVAHCAALGQALAGLHLAAADYPGDRANPLSLAGWRDLAAATLPRADEQKPGLAAAIADELAALGGAWPADLPRGIIHGDLFPDNVFFLGDRLSGVIDFYFACADQLAYDLAICLNAWCFEADASFNVTKGRAMIERYHAVRPLTVAEQAMLPTLARGAALRFLLTRLYDRLNPAPGALVRPKNPIDYLQRLRFHQHAATIAAYGATGLALA